MTPSKRKTIQAILDHEEGPWIIMKPSRFNPDDPEQLCIFENPAERTRAETEIPMEWFESNQQERIQQAVREAVRVTRNR